MPSNTSKKLNAFPKRGAAFIEPMECLPANKLPEGQQWLYEIKLEGYRRVSSFTGEAREALRLLSKDFGTIPQAYAV